jgi:cell division protein FtsA
MFALGGRSFTRRLANEMGMSLEEAERFKLAHAEGRLPAEQDALARATLEPTAEVLAQGVALTLEELSGKEQLPPALYLAGGGASLPEVAEQLSAVDWPEMLPMSRQPTVRVLGPADVQGIHDSTGLLVGSQDVTPMGLAYHAVSLEDDADQPLGGLMRRVMKAMKV